MKKIFLFFLLGMGVLNSCKKSESFLDQKNSTDLTEATVFTDSVRTLGFLNGVYAAAGYSFAKGRWSGHGNLEVASDEAEYRYSGTTQYGVIIYSGTINPGNFWGGTTLPDFWSTPYNNIRRVNLFIDKVAGAPLTQATKTRLIAEARFLRVWYYHYLLKTFGGVPLVGDQVFGNEDLINLPRASFESCVNYIASECDAAAAILPRDHLEQDFGRITKGACLALKSRVLLSAASPLFNGGGIVKDGLLGPVVAYPSADASRWQKAADAAAAVISMARYSLVIDNATQPGYGFYKAFISRVNDEIIFEFTRSTNRDFEGHYGPPSRSGGFYAQPTQNLVDAFGMLNGKSITDANSGYSATNPYANRDPRLGYTVMWNGSSWSNSTGVQAPVYTYNLAPSDGYGIATTTGYYGRKMCDVNVAYNNSTLTERGYPLIRYGEILLNYAEAINEADQTSLALAKLIELRARAGIQPGTDRLYGLKSGMTKEEMRVAVRNERQIELAFEDQRFYDERRWKIAETTENGYNKVMKITLVSTGVYTYEILSSVRKHNFRPANYLLPIPQPEILKMPAMVQNPGY